MAVRISKPKTYSAADMYKAYKKQHPDSEVTYWMYKEVLARFNKKASDAVIFGSLLNLGSHLGYILIKKIRRNHRKLEPDWGESNRIRAKLIEEGKTPKDQDHPDGEEWIKFYTDAWYLRWAWMKRHVCNAKNQSVYKFIPTSNRSKKAGENTLDKLGNKGKLVLANKLNPALHLTYERNSNFEIK